MALPGNLISTTTRSAPFRAPRDRVVTRYTSWERGGAALNSAAQGLDVYDWFIRVDKTTGAVYYSVPVDETRTSYTIPETLVYTISPLPVEAKGSFDTNMRPIIAWRDVNGISWLRWFDPVANNTVNTQLPTRCHSLRVALDDTRTPMPTTGITDTILAYVRYNTCYYRQLRDRFLTEYTVGQGFPQLYQIGLNELLRFQFARSPEQPDRDPYLNYLLPPHRAGKLVGFDEIGDAAVYDFVDSGVVGEPGVPSSSDKLVLTTNGQTFFLRESDGDWLNSSVEVQFDFYTDTFALRARRSMLFAIDTKGNITRTPTSSVGEVGLRYIESGSGTRTYTLTIVNLESGLGLTFNLISVAALPTFGAFTPNWNGQLDFFGRGQVPTGAISYADYGTYVVLHGSDSGTYAARSTTNRLRWPAGTLPIPLRPVSARTVPCNVVNADVTVPGQMQVNPDGSVEFWPMAVNATRLVRGVFAFGAATHQKGLPSTWQVTFAKASESDFQPIPVLDSINPTTVARFSTGVTITLTGSNFRANSVARVDGAPVTTTFNSSTELEFNINDTLLEDAASYDIDVFTPAPGGGLSAVEVLAVENPVPVLTSIDPTEIEGDSAEFTLTLTGTSFVPESIAEWNGTPLSTTYVNSTTLTAVVPASFIELVDIGTYDITVVTPSPGGGTSGSVVFAVTGVSADWTPADITTQAWFDASDTASLTISTGVSQWNDKSGNARHVTQATSANQPASGVTTLNSLNVLDFDGSNDCLRRTGGVSGLLQNVGEASVHAVYRQTSAPIAGSSDVLYSVTTNSGASYRAVMFMTGSPPESSGNGHRVGGQRADGDSLSNNLVLHPIPAFNVWHIQSERYDYTNTDLFPYKDGVPLTAVTSFGTAGSTSNTTPASLDIGCDNAGGQPLTGNLAELIITHSASNYQRYLVEGYLAHKWGLAGNLPAYHPFKLATPVVADPYINNVILLMNCEGADTGTTLVDASPASHALTVGSGVTTVTAQQKYGNASARVTVVGSGGISVAGSSDKDLLAQDFTMELFVRFNSTTPQQCFLNQYSFTDGNRAWWFRLATGPNLQFGYSSTGLTSGDVLATSSWTPSTGVWYHVAVCRSGSDLRMFVDGTQVGSTHNIGTTSIAASTENLGIGAFFPASANATQQCDAWLDEIRITLGTARYTANFTPPVATHPAA